MARLAKICLGVVLPMVWLGLQHLAVAQDENKLKTPPPAAQNGKGESDSKSNDSAKPAAVGQKQTENKVTFTGTVIDDQDKPVAGATIMGIYTDLNFHEELIPYPRRKLTTGDDGRFELKRGKIPIILQAMSPDCRLIGIARVDADTKEATVRVGPVAQAKGQLIDQAGNPVIRGYISYAIRVPEENGGPGGFTQFPYLGVALVDVEGRYTLTGLAPGNTYEAMYVAPSINSSPMPDLGRIRPTADEMLDVGTKRLSESFKMTGPVMPAEDSLEQARNRQKKVSELVPKVFAGIDCDFAVQRAVGSNPLDNNNLPADFDTMLSMVPGVKWQEQWKTSRVLVDLTDFKAEGLADVPVYGWIQDKPMIIRLKIADGGKIIDFHTWQEMLLPLVRKLKLQAMLGAPLARKLNKKPGDAIELYGEKFQMVGIYESPLTEENDGVIVDILDLQQLTNQEGEVSGFGITAERQLDNEGLEQLRHHIAAIQPRLKVTRVPRAIGNDAGK